MAFGNFGQGSETTWMDEVKCLGNETSLDQCRFDDWGKTNCNHKHDVSVTCEDTPTQGKVIVLY